MKESMPDNYPSSSEIMRNLSQVTMPYEVLLEDGKFRVIRFDPPFWGGYEFWVVNEKGFFWEPAVSSEAALEYLMSDEAVDYNRGIGPE